VPPPPSPVECGDDEAFAAIEHELALTLPIDYKQYIAAYGSGGWHGFWWLLNPFAENEHMNLLIQSQNRRPKKWSCLDAERATREAVNAKGSCLVDFSTGRAKKFRDMTPCAP
jgi:hypothetical protein